MSSVGETLANERRRLGKTIAEVESATRIRAGILHALENEEWDRLPSAAYVKGYIQNYATFLGIPPAPLLRQFDSQARLRPPQEQFHLPDVVVPTREQSHAIPMRTGILIVATIAVVALVLWGISRIVARPESEPQPVAPVGSVEETKPAESSSQPTKPAPSAVPTEQAPAEEEPPPGDSFTLTVRVAEGSASWLRVSVDGLKAYEGTMPGGQQRSWTVSDEAQVRIGKPEAVTVLRDGKHVTIPGGADIPTVTLRAGE